MKYGSLVYNSTLNNAYAETAYTAEDFVNNAMAAYRNMRKSIEQLTVEQINDSSENQVQKERDIKEARNRLRDNDPVFMPLKSVPESERAERRSRSEDLHKKMYKKIAEIQISELPADDISFRYANEFFMKYGTSEEVKAYNETVYEHLSNPQEHLKEFLQYHRDALKKLGPEGYNVEKLATDELDDKTLVEKFEAVHYCSQLLTQFQNIRGQFAKNNIHPVDGEEKKLYDECESLMRKYEPYALPMNALDSRLGLIANPFYEFGDINSPEYMNFAKGLEENDPGNVFDREDDPFVYNGKSCFLDFVTLGTEINKLGILGDLEQAEKHFAALDVKKEDISYRIIKDGVVSENKNYNSAEVNTQLSMGQNVRVELFDKNAPDNKIALFSDTRGDFVKATLKNKTVAPKKPEAPNFFKKLLHKISNKNYKKEFDDYYRKKSVYDAYKTEQEHKAAVNTAAEGKRARMRIAETKNGEIGKKLSTLSHKTNKDFDFQTAISELIRTDRDDKSTDKVRDYLVKLSPSGYDALYTGYMQKPEEFGNTLYKLAGVKAPTANAAANNAPAASVNRAAGSEPNAPEQGELLPG